MIDAVTRLVRQSASYRIVICPKCGVGTSPTFARRALGTQGPGAFVTSHGNCTECDQLIVFARWQVAQEAVSDDFMIYPPGPRARPIPEEVTNEYARDFAEACHVLDFSPKASAALSRRLLQHIIREKGGIKKRNLDEEIDEVIEQGHLSSDLAEDLDMIRTIGNFAAHPIKSTNTGEVVDVEPGEAEALLDLLEQLFDHYFGSPARRAKRRKELNAKLAEAGKQPLKGTVAESMSTEEAEPEVAAEQAEPPPGPPPVL